MGMEPILCSMAVAHHGPDSQTKGGVPVHNVALSLLEALTPSRGVPSVRSVISENRGNWFALW